MHMVWITHLCGDLKGRTKKAPAEYAERLVDLGVAVKPQIDEEGNPILDAPEPPKAALTPKKRKYRKKAR